MTSNEVVDVSGRRGERRRQMLQRVGGPVLGVALVILSVLGVSLYSDRANRAGALVLSTEVLDAMQARISQEVSSYLNPAIQAAFVARDMVSRGAIPDGQTAIEGFASSMLAQVASLEGFYLADGDGDFTIVGRDPAGGTDTKLITNRQGTRQTLSMHRDEAGRILSQTTDLPEDLDLRGRFWYKGALMTNGVYWSAPYIFYNTLAPGITAAIRLRNAGSKDSVVGVDITLEALSGFLASLRIGQTGRAAIVDQFGNVIAAPGLLRAAGTHRPQRVLTATGALNDPALTGAFDRFRVDGYGERTIDVGGKLFVALASRLPAAGQDWILLIAAPQSDFTGFAEKNSRQNVLLSLITIGLTAFLGLALIWQNRRSYQLARLLARQRMIGAREFQALSALAAQPGLFDPEQPMPSLTATLAEMSAARRVSIWHLVSDGRTLQCEDQFERQSGHTEGLELSRSELPLFFGALDQGEAIDTIDAAADKRTVELHRLLMRPFESRMLSTLPIHGPGGVSGVVMLEDARDHEQARSFAEAVSSIAAMRIAARRPEDGSVTSPDLAADGIYPLQYASGETGAFSPTLTTDAIDPSILHAAYFPSVTAMVIQFDDAVTLAKADATGVMALADRIATAMQAIATRYALPYMKLTGHTLIAAAGCTQVPDPSATMRLADAALAARESCLSLLAQSGLEPVFRIGIDFGPAFGCLLGQHPRQFNLWGDVIRTAELMARSVADSGSIQVSEHAYEQLRQYCLFRSRGVFYSPRVGRARVFIMAGRR